MLKRVRGKRGKRGKGKKLTEYALYKGDEFIDLGTVRELAKKYNVTEEYIRFISSPAHKKRRRRKSNLCL